MRDRRIQVALTKEEHAHIEAKKTELGYFSLSQTMRWLMFGNVHNERSPNVELISRHLYLLNNAANNLNQIARSANSGAVVDTDDVLAIAVQFKKHSQQTLREYKKCLGGNQS